VDEPLSRGSFQESAVRENADDHCQQGGDIFPLRFKAVICFSLGGAHSIQDGNEHFVSIYPFWARCRKSHFGLAPVNCPNAVNTETGNQELQHLSEFAIEGEVLDEGVEQTSKVCPLLVCGLIRRGSDEDGDAGEAFQQRGVAGCGRGGR